MTEAIRNFCGTNQGVVKENPTNCAQYFDCGEESIRARTFLRECPYPMQFATTENLCKDFTTVNCQGRGDVKAPCEYDEETTNYN